MPVEHSPSKSSDSDNSLRMLKQLAKENQLSNLPMSVILTKLKETSNTNPPAEKNFNDIFNKELTYQSKVNLLIKQFKGNKKVKMCSFVKELQKLQTTKLEKIGRTNQQYSKKFGVCCDWPSSNLNASCEQYPVGQPYADTTSRKTMNFQACDLGRSSSIECLNPRKPPFESETAQNRSVSTLNQKFHDDFKEVMDPKFISEAFANPYNKAIDKSLSRQEYRRPTFSKNKGII